MSETTLYSMVICPFAQRTRIHLARKGIDFDLVNLDICAPRPDWYLKLNPKGQVPTLKVGEHTVSDSNAVSEYIEAAFPGTDLYFGDATIRAHIGSLMEFVDRAFIPRLYHLLAAATREERTQRIERAQETFAWLDAWLKEAFDAGYPEHEIGMAEIVVAPFLLRYEVVAYYQDFDVAGCEQLHHFNAWRARLLAETLVVETAESLEDLIKMYADYTIGYYNGAVPPNQERSSSDLSIPLSTRPLPPKAKSVRRVA
ncbi:MAG: glutathione S-transferase family protein [Pseudomonadota bacterium]